MSKKLIELNPGDEGIICSLAQDGNSDFKRHLLGMGFVKGAKIKLEKVAPLGDPYEFKIKGYTVCLRKEEAENILIEDKLCYECPHSERNRSLKGYGRHNSDEDCGRHKRFGFF